MSETITLKPNISKTAQIVSLIMILIVGVISNYIYVLSVYVGPLNEAHGWPMNSIVLTYSMAMFCEFPAFIVGGLLSNKFGMKKMLLVSGALYGLAILFSGMTSSIVVFIICQGIIGSLAMYGVFICTLALINVLYTERKGLVMGLLYGSQAAGAAAMAPLAVFFIEHFNVSMALILQGVIFTVVMIVCCLLVTDPTKGNKELAAKLQEEAEASEELLKNGKKPTMGWKKALTHPAFWILFISVIMIQLIGNVLITDTSILAESIYGVTATEAALIVSLFSISAGVGGVVVGFVSDKIGPYKTTMILGVADGILLGILAMTGAGSYMAFAVIVTIQGFTYNGITTLNPVMMTDSYRDKDLGTTMGFMGIAIIIVGIIGPQLGLSVPFVPMLIVCAVLSIIGGILAIVARNMLNKYYAKELGENIIK